MGAGTPSFVGCRGRSRAMVRQERCWPWLCCHPMGLQPLLCSLPSPGWFMVTVSPPAKTTATAWLKSPVMREAAATCEIRAWYHLSGSGEGAHGGHGRASGSQAQGSDDGLRRQSSVCPCGSPGVPRSAFWGSSQGSTRRSSRCCDWPWRTGTRWWGCGRAPSAEARAGTSWLLTRAGSRSSSR